MSKIAQYANDYTIMCVGFSKVSLKEAQSSLYKTITWTKKSRKGGQNGKNHVSLQGCLLRCWGFQWKLGLLLESSYSKKHYNIKMQFLFAMDNNKLHICHLKFLYSKLGLLFEPLRIFIPYCKALCFEPKSRFLVVV
jgi:hypothetical protein